MEATRFAGAKIGEARTACRITQAQLADQLNVSLATIKGWESGARTPNGNSLAALATVLGVRVSYFFNDQVDPDPVVSKIVEGFPPLTERQKARIIALLTSSKSTAA